MPINIFISEYIALKESIVVKVPAPEIKGNAKGTMEEVPALLPSSLKR